MNENMLVDPKKLNIVTLNGVTYLGERAETGVVNALQITNSNPTEADIQNYFTKKNLNELTNVEVLGAAAAITVTALPKNSERYLARCNMAFLDAVETAVPELQNRVFGKIVQ
jgi:hypothetical protein